MAEELKIYQRPGLQGRQIVAVVARSVAVNIFTLTIWPFAYALFFILFFTAHIVAMKVPPAIELIMLFTVVATGFGMTGMLGYVIATFGHGPRSLLTYQKMKVFASTSLVAVSPLVAYCVYLITLNNGTDTAYLAFYAAIALPTLCAYLLGQIMAVIISAKKLKSGQIKKG